MNEVIPCKLCVIPYWRDRSLRLLFFSICGRWALAVQIL